MSTFTILLIVALVVCLILIPLVVFSLWISAKIFRVPDVTFGKALKIGLLIVAMNLAFRFAEAGLSLVSNPNIAIALVFSAISCFVAWYAIRLGFKSSGAKAIGIIFVSSVIAAPIAMGVALTFRALVAEAFVVPTGAMATTLLGHHSDIQCGNCGARFAVGRMPLDDPVGWRRERLQAQCPNCGRLVDVNEETPVQGSDRMLIAKTKKAQRGDLVVYGFARPKEFDLPDVDANYVKRLIGLPGENVEIAGGDVFIDGERWAKRPEEFLDLWFQLHDTKFVPKEVDDDTPSWRAGNGGSWTLDGTVWKFNGAEGRAADLNFDGRITDRLAYNAKSDQRRMVIEDQPVGDIRIDCMRKITGQGKWTITWEFGGQSILCDFSANGDVDLTRKPPDELPGMAGLPTTRHGSLTQPGVEPSTVSLAIRDGRAYVMEGDYNHVRASLQIAPDKLSDVRPQSDQKPGRLSIHAEGDCKLELERIQIWRDVYYLPGPARQEWVRSAAPWTVELAKDEWFFLGDNSSQSSDSRYNGPTKTEALIGVARFIYWPLSRWHSFD